MRITYHIKVRFSGTETANSEGITVKKVFSVLLCFLMVFGLLPVNAARKKSKTYSLSYPWTGDKNLNTKDNIWGRPVTKLMGGWVANESYYTRAYTVESYQGQICYCIEPGVNRPEEKIVEAYDENYWDNYPANINPTIKPETMKTLLGRVLNYGYRGNIKQGWYTQNSKDADKLSHIMATQILVWEVIVGERDEDFNSVPTGNYAAAKSTVNPKHPLYERFIKHYDEIVKSVQAHTVCPSFMKKDAEEADCAKLELNGVVYTLTLTDTNNVLSNFTFSSTDANLALTVNGNQLTISSAAGIAGTGLITATKKQERSGVIIWSDGKTGIKGGIQDVATYSGMVEDTVRAYLKVNDGSGKVKIKKTSEDGKIEGLSFTIEGNGINRTVQTDSLGEITVSGLKPGKYTVTEESRALYEPRESKVVTVNENQTATVMFDNVLRRGKLIVVKSAEDNTVNGVKFHLYGTSLSGAQVDEYAVTGKDGKAYFNDILIGTGYTLEEVNTAGRYIVPAAQKADIEWNKVTNKSVRNVLVRGRVKGIKKEENGTGLGGAVIGLFKNGSNSPLMTTVSADDGSFFFNDVPYGDYVVREIVSPRYYLLDEKNYEVKIDAEGDVVEVELVNKLGGSVQVTKVDADYPDHYLTGAILMIYQGDQTIGQMTEQDKGVYRMDGLAPGDYTLKETQAPDGFCLDSKVYSFTIQEKGKTVIVETETGKGFINQAQKGSIHIEKSSEDGTLKGFTFRVEGKDFAGNFFSREYVTDGNGHIDIENIRVGNYTIYEVANEATKKYILSPAQTVKVETQKSAAVAFENILLPDPPETGDNTHPAVWAMLAGASVIVALLAGICTAKRKKQNAC